MSTFNQPLTTADQQRLDGLYEKIQQAADVYVGFPWNSKFDYQDLFRFLNYPINNDGDPYVESGYHLNTHDFEREVLATFAELTQAPEDSYWGYITSGGTEGNLYGIFLARELYPDGVFYCSQETFAMKKLLRCLRIRNVVVKSHDNGCIDLDHLRSSIEAHDDSPAIILANIGTTLKGAVDDLPGIYQVLDELGVEQRYVHADAALSGMVLPFVEDASPWNFSAGVDSLSISLHKMVGSPLPCGVVLADKARVSRVAALHDDAGRLDTTILASRNAVTPLFLWYAFRTVGLDGFRRRVDECSQIADYAIRRLKNIGYNAWRHSYSNTVVFARPSHRLVNKWQLFAEGDTAHLIAMPHVTHERIDRLITDLEADSNNIAAKQLVGAANRGRNS